MNKFLLSLITVTLVATALPCRGQTISAPRMVLEETSFDFGKVDEGTVVEHDFIVVNKGNQPLEIMKVVPG